MPAPSALTPHAGPADSADPLRDALVAALGAQYEILRLLGRGGMGAVYLVRERMLERLVAIKVLPHADAADEHRERFQREARTVAQLTHPRIVPLHSIGEAHGTLFCVMGYVQGESLEALLKREGGSPPSARSAFSPSWPMPSPMRISTGLCIETSSQTTS